MAFDAVRGTTLEFDAWNSMLKQARDCVLPLPTAVKFEDVDVDEIPARIIEIIMQCERSCTLPMPLCVVKRKMKSREA